MKHIQNFDNFVNEAATVAISPVGLRGQSFVVKVNGKEYGYGAKEGDLDIKEVAEKFGKLLKYSTGRALAWLKKHTDLVSGSAKNESEDFEAIGFDLSESFDDLEEDLLEAKEEKAEDKKEEKKDDKEEEEKEEESGEFTPTSALEYLKTYAKAHKDKLTAEEKEDFSKLQDLMKTFIKERKAAGRKYE